jgi:hypothetical protein
MCAENQWKMDFTDVTNLLKQIKRIPNRSEAVINRRLREFGAPIAMQTIQEAIPVSLKRNKKHARNSNALRVKHDNLAFTIRPKPSFEYIKYPDLGIGTSKRNAPEQFMKKGLNKVRSKIISDLERAVSEEIQKDLKG